MEITQRPANLGDASVLLDWRNNPNVRKFSLNTGQISIDEHLLWLSGRLARIKLEPFFLFSEGENLIGMSRLDIAPGSTDRFEISILVDPSQHSKGFGTRMLDMTCKSFFCLHPDQIIVAKVHTLNSISQRLFTSAGFKQQAAFGDFLHFEKTFKSEKSGYL
jgi:RimJ/RimL family protein N-acetyltransferase